MQKYKVETEEGKVLNFSVPQSWNEISFRDFLEFVDHREDLEFLISVITGLPTDFINKPEYAEFTGRLLAEIEKLGQFPDLQKDPKKVWRYKEEEVILTVSDFKWTVSLSQQIDAVYYQQKAKEKGEDATEKDVLQVFPEICSIFMQPYFDGSKEYDQKKAKKYLDYFLDAPFEEVVKLGSFFLRKLQSLKSSSMESHLKQSSIMTRLKQVLKIFLKPLASIRLFIIYRRAVLLSRKKF